MNNTSSAGTRLDVTDVEQLVPLFVDRFNEGDIDGVCALYEATCRVTAGPGDYHTGHDAIIGGLGAIYFWGYRVKCALRRIHVAQDIALSSHELVFSNLDPTIESMETMTTEVHRRGPNGQWRVVIDDPFWLVPNAADTPDRTWSPARRPEEIVPMFLERYANNRMAGVADLYTEDAAVHVGGGRVCRGRGAARSAFSMMRAVGIEMKASARRIHVVGDVALMSHELTVPGRGPAGTDVVSITTETARRCSDGAWRLAIDDPMWLAD